MHDEFDKLLAELSFTEEHLRHLREAIKEGSKEDRSSQVVLINKKRKEVRELEAKMDNLGEKVINDELEPETYKKYYQKYQGEIAVLNEEIAALQQGKEHAANRLDNVIDSLRNLRELYHGLTLFQQHSLLRGAKNVWFIQRVVFEPLSFTPSSAIRR